MSDTKSITDPAVVADQVGKKYPLSGSHKRTSRGSRSHFGADYVDALRDVSFVARKGESIGIIGRNGSGKSTLLRLIAGGEAATSGAVYVSNQPTLLGVSPALQGWLTGEQNIYLGLLALGMKPNDAKQTIPEIVEWTELGEASKRPMSTYSSGMGAKLSFAISTAIRPEILLVDESLSTGDAAFAAKARERMSKLLSNAGNIFLVSHSLPTISDNCERALWIHDGDLVADGGSGEITELYTDFSKMLQAGQQEKARQFLTKVTQESTKVRVNYR